MKHRILDPRERKALPVRHQLRAVLAEHAAAMLAGQESPELGATVSSLHQRLKGHLGDTAVVKCFRCGADLDMATCPPMYVVIHKYTANDTGGYGGAESFQGQGGGRQFVLCPPCDEHAEAYDAAQEVEDDPEPEPARLEREKGKA